MSRETKEREFRDGRWTTGDPRNQETKCVEILNRSLSVRPLSRPIYSWSVNRSVSQSVSQLVSQSVSQGVSVKQPVGRSVGQLVFSQSVSHSRETVRQRNSLSVGRSASQPSVCQ